ncbi:glycoside hydrolase family 9 protein [Xanthomonas campestris pv. raphani]|uniref:glycoside hydrolase family 9 protein n=2 Tax=Xanthomonas campestris TaxID=339 RepID=UPI002B22FC21|nr:glycoside hydrolase family 9 protein [Xanthomonas campestris]MEA9650560.1 glycoside hydrolase family 9 protein [Xanthomonas campestris pv. raphani]MEA9743467.1 glycoside hydrolase family 9 protein [Xanthomonas campestris pv. raphani]MEA9767467.1 glycoside hydrolase family 9 protein [Xanthomonas campestris pv. raphani]MEA9868723.1 glycoside hydrolase family 9 protein [Xanthomonas campestris pv. raphani]
MTIFQTLLTAMVIASPIAACAADTTGAAGTTPAASATIHVNQLGYLPGSAKLAVVGLPASAAAGPDRFTVEDAKGARVLEGSLSPAATWAPAGQQARVADFSALRTPGTYRLKIAGMPASDAFLIAARAYQPVVDASLKAFYYNRASTELPAQFAGRYARAAGHPDTDVRIHPLAASASRPANSVISAPKGWYDAGDYNKYIVNSGISTYTLLAAYEHYPALFKAQALTIPNDAPGVPGILQEVWWNLEWMLAMQDPADGGVYHKLTDKQFDGLVMPDQAKQQRYVVMKATAATLDFAAVMAAASRVYAPFDKQYPGASARMLKAARSAWAWAQQHPNVIYRQPDDVRTGGYDDATVDDEFAWAAAELYVSTREDAFYDAMLARNVHASVPGWSNVGGLAWMSLAAHRDQLTPHADRARIEGEISGLAQRLGDQWQASPWRLAMADNDFVWGSNAVVLNQAMMLLQGYRVTQQRRYLDAAQSQLDYILGRNPLGLSFVTGVGQRTPMHIHHRPSEADGIDAPVPGWLAGGPQPGQQDAKDCKVAYPSKLAALSYLDNTCSYATNEVAINWNAPLVYVSAAIEASTR